MWTWIGQHPVLSVIVALLGIGVLYTLLGLFVAPAAKAG